MKYFLFIIAFLIVLTTVIVSINPQMHKPMNIGGADIIVQNNSYIKNTDIKVDNKDSIIDKNSISVNTTDSIKTVENVTTKNVEFNDKWDQLLKIQEQEEANRKAAEAKRLAAEQKKLQDEQAKKLAQQKAQQEAKKKAEALAKKQAEEQARKLAEQQAQQEAKKKAEEETKRLAEQKRLQEEQAKKLAQQKAQEEAKKKAEEAKKQQIIAQENILWNQWRANVCNKITQNIDMQILSAVPNGTIYTYSFNVDNQKRISNVSVRISRGSPGPTTHNGIYMIQRTINNLNSNSILTFPSGTQRTSVNVSSSIQRITGSGSSSLNASNFNDVETIIKQK